MELYSELEVTKEVALAQGLTEDEWEQILNIMGRVPTYTEIGIYGVLWSEHCSYKNSIKLLKTLPKEGANLLVEAGEENAGLVDIGNGYAICFKIESHNHPSAIEPFQGAATGVGGILRDIFTMGARPIAALNSLRFGNLDSDKSKFLLRGVVEGIAHYGNCFGVPTVGGEIYFDDCYMDNPLVNAMAVGIVDTKKVATAAAAGKGNPVVYIGSSTGRDGIHGASLLASREFDDATENMRPTVQVGDPFAEKTLLEATLELIDAGVVVGIQDMGAAGLSCSTAEMSAKNGMGMDIDLDKVPMRESGMTPYEIMLSESQERMLAVIDKDKEDVAHQICRKWGVNSVRIGTVTDDGLVHLYREGKYVAELKADTLVLGGGAPQNDRPAVKPKYLDEVNKYDVSFGDKEIGTKEHFWTILQSPTVASKRWIYEQYDSQVRTNTMNIHSDSAVLRLKEIPGKGIAVTTDCNSRFTYLDPYVGGLSAVSEAAINLACVGAKPVAITNCLNFGNPYDPEVYWQFKEVIHGISDACRAFNTPVTGGNVSFHNESQNHAIHPTPVIGMLGIIDDITKTMTPRFKQAKDRIFILGDCNKSELGGSEFLKVIKNVVAGKTPALDLPAETRLVDALLELIAKQAIASAHDVTEGGIPIALAESCIDGKLGCSVSLRDNNISYVFGETQGRVIISTRPADEKQMLAICEKYKIEVNCIGEVQEKIFKIAHLIETDINKLIEKYEGAIPEIMR
ncbi:MAG: phosphoribosylformylglycinamidine synthase subunit PurL [Ignavibacteria bacterium]|jgi:phosphoribosylformylglycinamidine synthase|nr:phosphoribosylformylglycinamidine synthase subunit PurL [Ignavibacteria bacterium]